MLVIAILTFAAFAATWLLFSIIAYTAIYGSLIFSYFCVWDEATRKSICPKGLWHAIIYDE